MIEAGFTNVTPILGGFNAWVQAGYPVEASSTSDMGRNMDVALLQYCDIRWLML